MMDFFSGDDDVSISQISLSIGDDEASDSSVHYWVALASLRFLKMTAMMRKAMASLQL